VNDSIWVVIPAFGEATVIRGVVAHVRTRCSHVVVIDDCSGDATAAEALAAGAHVLRHPVNLGQGAALQTGIDYALAAGADYVLTFDADGQHDVADLPVLLDAQRRTGADVVLGSRFLGRADAIPPHRRALLHAARFFTWATAGLRLTDAHNGYRLLTREAAQRIRLRQNRMAHASEIVEQIRAAGLRWTEAPVTIRYTDYSLAKGQRSSAAVRIVVDLLVARLNR
jgi:glycosyltransferase involved in cell wall biosynthesis